MKAAMWIAVVVLPLPPLKFAMQIIIETLRHDAAPDGVTDRQYSVTRCLGKDNVRWTPSVGQKNVHS